MSYLLSSLKNAEEQRKQKICQDEIKSLDQSDDKELNQSCNHAFEMKSTNEAHQNNFILENSSNQFSTKKNISYAFLIATLCFVGFAYIAWFSPVNKTTQENNLTAKPSSFITQAPDTLTLKLDKELPTSQKINKQNEGNSQKK